MSSTGIGPIGRILRFIIGGYLLLVAIPYYLFPGINLTILGSTYLSSYDSGAVAATMALGFLAFYLLIHRASTTFWRNINRWAGALLANVPPLAMFVIAAYLGLASIQIAVLTYVGAAMVLAGWRRDPGCEVLSPANALMRTQSHFACIVFSPVDWAERKIHASPKNGTNYLGSRLGA